MIAVSVILPTYNRARFLPEAIASIRGQEFADWELIVVDDGSTDETAELLPELIAVITQPARIIRQENQGAYAARNTGLDHARGEYIAFYDSDDLWLPHHLRDCVAALDANADVDWAYGACRLVDYATGSVLEESSFYVEGKPRPFMELGGRRTGEWQLVDSSPESAAICQIRDGFYCGLQNSVLRRNVFADYRFESASRNEAEDQMIVIDYLLRGGRLAFVDHVHVVYRVHGENSSATGAASHAKKSRVMTTMAQGFERLLERKSLPQSVARAIRERLGEEYFWHLGYSLNWMCGRKSDAIKHFVRGLRYWPWDWRRWKTLFACASRSLAPTKGSNE